MSTTEQDRYVHIQEESFPNDSDQRYDEYGQPISPEPGEAVIYQDKSGSWCIERLWIKAGRGGSGRCVATGMEKGTAELLADLLNQKSGINPVRGSKVGEMSATLGKLVVERDRLINRHDRDLQELDRKINAIRSDVALVEDEKLPEATAYGFFRKYMKLDPEPDYGQYDLI